MAVQASPLMFNNTGTLESVDDGGGGGWLADGTTPQLYQFQPQQTRMMVEAPPGLLTMVENHGHEMDQYLLQQTAQLRAALVQQRKNQMAWLARKATSVLTAKDKELAMAKQRRVALEGRVKAAEKERDAWEMAAREKGAIAASLNYTLDQLKEPCFSSTTAAGDVMLRRRLCRSCGLREACMVLLPCRHLCVCQPCEQLVEACPACCSVKRGITEVFLA